MRQEIARRLQKVFTERVTQLSPAFMPVESEYVDQRDRLYMAELFPDVFAFFCLLFSPKGYDEFNVEVSWSVRPEYPLQTGFGMPVDIPEIGIQRGRPLNGSFTFRLANLIPPHNDKWWNIDVTQQVEPIVDHVMKLIEEHAIPYLLDEAERWSAHSDGDSI